MTTISKQDFDNVHATLCRTEDMMKLMGINGADWKVPEILDLIKQGVDLEAEDSLGRTPLYLASWWGHTSIAKLLLEKGADPTHCGHSEESPHLRAFLQKHFDIVDMLIETKRGIDLGDDRGNSLLMYAVKKNNIRFTKKLIEYGANINHENYAGGTPLLFGAHFKSMKAVKILIDAGADIHAKDNQAEKRARQEGHIKIADYIKNTPKRLQEAYDKKVKEACDKMLGATTKPLPRKAFKGFKNRP